MPPAPVMPTAQARNVAGALTKLLAEGLSWEPPATSPVPRFRLTFYICRCSYSCTVLAASFDPPFLDWTTLWGCLSKMADLAVGWVRKGGPIY